MANVTRRSRFTNEGIFAKQVQEPHLTQICRKVLPTTARPYAFPIKHHRFLMDTEIRTQATVGKKSLGTQKKPQSEWTFADDSTAKLALVLGSW